MTPVIVPEGFTITTRRCGDVIWDYAGVVPVIVAVLSSGADRMARGSGLSGQ